MFSLFTSPDWNATSLFAMWYVKRTPSIFLKRKEKKKENSSFCFLCFCVNENKIQQWENVLNLLEQQNKNRIQSCTFWIFEGVTFDKTMTVEAIVWYGSGPKISSKNNQHSFAFCQERGNTPSSIQNRGLLTCSLWNSCVTCLLFTTKKEKKLQLKLRGFCWTKPIPLQTRHITNLFFNPGKPLLFKIKTNTH